MGRKSRERVERRARTEKRPLCRDGLGAGQLGGSRQRIVTAIFRRPLIQMALGVLAGIAFIAYATFMYPSSEGPGAGEAAGLTLRAIAMQAAYAAVMFGVCMLACVVPTRRALNIEPTTALRTE